jgi:hypothetical protein
MGNAQECCIYNFAVSLVGKAINKIKLLMLSLWLKDNLYTVG